MTGQAMSELTDDRLLPCPFCGSTPQWLRKDMNFGTGASGMEAPMRSLGCDNPDCQVTPHTGWLDTEEYYGPNEAKYQGYHKVNHDAEAIAAWNRRAAASTSTEGAGVKENDLHDFIWAGDWEQPMMPPEIAGRSPEYVWGYSQSQTLHDLIEALKVRSLTPPAPKVTTDEAERNVEP